MFVKQLVLVVLFPAQGLQFLTPLPVPTAPSPSQPFPPANGRPCQEPCRDVGVYILVIVSIDLMFHLRLVAVVSEDRRGECGRQREGKRSARY